MPEYLFRRTRGIVRLLKRLIEDGCTEAIESRAEELPPELLSVIPTRLGNIADRDAAAGEIPDIPEPEPGPVKKPRRKAATRSSTTRAGRRLMPGIPDVSELRPLPRSLDPLEGEALSGYLLRLAHRPHIDPHELLFPTGLARGSG
ncbi:hypothetical protein ACIHCQ_35980 [Streptomyces sp. NPDC052236]|uniref:hypothetical protein n=1 Tax=Streptomyces sp. NPDC052236 TaxID=3365686 RepID=UPI0037D5A50B